ncbi:hypothetical protein KM043_003164 [Ampulex compressa]|nr:hypothetical protein KM043_003164 [Ampulex compressa]
MATRGVRRRFEIEFFPELRRTWNPAIILTFQRNHVQLMRSYGATVVQAFRRHVGGQEGFDDPRGLGAEPRPRQFHDFKRTQRIPRLQEKGPDTSTTSKGLKQVHNSKRKTQTHPQLQEDISSRVFKRRTLTIPRSFEAEARATESSALGGIGS